MKSCDCCEYGNCIGDGALYCEYNKLIREYYDFSPCENFTEEE